LYRISPPSFRKTLFVDLAQTAESVLIKNTGTPRSSLQQGTMHLSRPSSDSHASPASKRSRKEGDDEEQKFDNRAEPKEYASSAEDSNGHSEDEDMQEGEDADSTNLSGRPKEVQTVRREKRLAMNRASARARRKRKKTLLDSLANQLTELTKRNQTLQLSNDTFQGRSEQLESALSQAQATISSLVADISRGSAMQPPHQQRGAAVSQQPFVAASAGATTGLCASNQEALRAFLLAASPQLNPTAFNVAASSVLEEQLRSAQAAQLLGQQQSRSTLMEAAGLDGLNRYQNDLLGALSSPMSNFL
jgi:hypothetical protein